MRKVHSAALYFNFLLNINVFYFLFLMNCPPMFILTQSRLYVRTQQIDEREKNRCRKNVQQLLWHKFILNISWAFLTSYLLCKKNLLYYNCISLQTIRKYGSLDGLPFEIDASCPKVSTKVSSLTFDINAPCQ